MHIVFLILKIIGILLLTLLGVLLFLAAVVLFAPFKYRVDGSCHGEIRFTFRASWLFQLLRVRAVYDLENGLEWQAAFAWLKLPRPEKASPDGDGTVSEEGVESSDIAAVMPEECEDVPDTAKNADAGHEEAPLQMMEMDTQESEAEAERKIPRIKRLFLEIRNRILGFRERIKRIKYTFRNICDKIKKVKDKKDTVLSFVQDKQNQKAFYYIWNQVQFILRKFIPKKFCIRGVLGFEDPAWTGQVFGGIAILYAWAGPGIQVVPNFDEKIADLDFFIKGHFRMIYVLIAGMRLMMDRGTRKLLMTMKKKFS